LNISHQPHLVSSAGGVFHTAAGLGNLAVQCAILPGMMMLGVALRTKRGHRLRLALWGVALVAATFATATLHPVGQEHIALAAGAVLAGAYLAESWHRRRRSVKCCPDCAEQVRAAASVCRYCDHLFNLPTSAAGLGRHPRAQAVLAVHPAAVDRHRRLVDALYVTGESAFAGQLAACVGAEDIRLVHAAMLAAGEHPGAAAVDELARVYERGGAPFVGLTANSQERFDFQLDEMLAPHRRRAVWTRRAARLGLAVADPILLPLDLGRPTALTLDRLIPHAQAQGVQARQSVRRGPTGAEPSERRERPERPG
jgi:hypothetical protein